MPELDADQIRALRARLDDREAELRGELRAAQAEQTEVPSKQPHNQVEDSGEIAEQRSRDAVHDAEKERDATELRDIAASKARMDGGAYGVCIDCGTDIPFARLQAVPSALRCLACEEKFERSHPRGPRMSPLA